METLLITLGAGALLPGAVSSMAWRRALRLPATSDSHDRRVELFLWSLVWLLVAFIAWPMIRGITVRAPSADLSRSELVFAFIACVIVPYVTAFFLGLFVRRFVGLDWLRHHNLIDSHATSPWHDTMLDDRWKVLYFRHADGEFRGAVARLDGVGEQVLVVDIEKNVGGHWRPVGNDLKAIVFPKVDTVAWFASG